MSQAALDAIELRLLGADHLPWGYQQSYRYVGKCSNKSLKKAIQHSSCDANGRQIFRSEAPNRHETRADDDRDGVRFDVSKVRAELELFRLAPDSTDEMGEFVAHAPADIEQLIGEVKFLRLQLGKARADRDEFKKEMLSLRIDSAALTQKLTEIRAGWRKIQEVMK